MTDSIDDKNRKVCKSCGMVYLRGKMGGPQFATRRYCSIACAHTAQIGVKRAKPRELTPEDMRECQICGASFIRRLKEPRSSFDRRRFCSKPCAYKAMRKPS